MQIIPAIDLKDNKCVRLKKGKDETSLVFNDDPKKQAKYFEKIGCKKIHIVDLDAAFGRPEVNISSIKEIRNSVSIPIQLGGGIRSEIQATQYFNLGINNIIIGSMSVNESETVKLLSEKYDNQIYVSLDIKRDSLMIKGWKEKSKIELYEILNNYKKSKIKGYIITDIENDGMLKGLDISFIKNTVNKININNSDGKKIIIAGGLTNYEDLHKLVNLNLKNIEGIISGKSFYVGNINLNEAQQILKNSG